MWELNIRTYVKVNGVSGVYFFTLETDSKISEVIARLFFHLPYRFSKIKADVSKSFYSFKPERKELSFHLEAQIEAQISQSLQSSEFHLWATERYSLFTKNQGKTYRGIVQHAPWELQPVDVVEIDDKFTRMVPV